MIFIAYLINKFVKKKCSEIKMTEIGFLEIENFEPRFGLNSLKTNRQSKLQKFRMPEIIYVRKS